MKSQAINGSRSSSHIPVGTEFRRPRLLFLDNLKVLFTVLVIFQHARVTYDGMGVWYYIESNPVDPFSEAFFLLLTSIGGLFQPSLMGLFFLMGGYFTPRSYDRKGAPSFWKERILRLGIPLLLYVLLLNPIMYYLLSALGIQPWSSNPTLQGSLLDYYVSRFHSLDRLIGFLTDTGPTWFLYVLLIFTAGYTLWRQMTKSEAVQRYIPKEFSIPRYPYLLLLAVGLGCVAFLVRLVFPIDEFPLAIPFAFLTQYVMMFAVGVIAVRYDWFKMMSKHHVRAWSITIAATAVLFYSYAFLALGLDSDFGVLMGGPTVHALVFAVVDNVICMGMIFVLISIFRLRFNEQGNLLRNLSASAFQMYLIHPPILVLVSLGFASVSLIPVVKLAIVFPLAVILCYLTSHFVLPRIRLSKH